MIGALCEQRDLVFFNSWSSLSECMLWRYERLAKRRMRDYIKSKTRYCALSLCTRDSATWALSFIVGYQTLHNRLQICRARTLLRIHANRECQRLDIAIEQQNIEKYKCLKKELHPRGKNRLHTENNKLRHGVSQYKGAPQTIFRYGALTVTSD